jgi:hypothetical protein
LRLPDEVSAISNKASRSEQQGVEMNQIACIRIAFLLTVAAALSITAPRAAVRSAQNPAGPALTLRVGAGGGSAELGSGNQVLAQGAQRPLLSILYSDQADIWKARTWQELRADAVVVRQGAQETDLEIASFGGQPVKVRLMGRLDSGRGEVAWSIELVNGARGTVVGVIGPGLAGIRDIAGGWLYFPDRPGQRLADPWQALSAKANRMEYPVPASMQYVVYAGADTGTASRSGVRGVAYHVFDQEMVYKQLVFGGADREISVIQYPFVAAGGRWQSPPIVWQALRRDWHEAADRYRGWFGSWAVRPAISAQVRAFPILAGTVVRARPVDDPRIHDVTKEQEVRTYAAALEQVRQLQQRGYEGAEFIGWFGRGHDTAYPDYDPAADMGGEEGLKNTVAEMHKMGLLAIFYLNARLGDYNSPTLQAHPEWEVELANGQRTKEGYGGETFAVMCPAVPGWQEHMRQQILRVERDYHGDGVQLDQVGAAWSFLCFNPAHGHRTPATAWTEGYTKMLRDSQRETRMINPQFWTWIEGAWEGAGQYVDLSGGGFWKRTPGSVTFPRLYRYTLPDHPMFGDPKMGGVPVWCPTDIHRAKKIYDAVRSIFWDGRFMDDIGLSAPQGAEAYWFRQGPRVVLTVKSKAPHVDLGFGTPKERPDVTRPVRPATVFTVGLNLSDLGRKTPPRAARALAADVPVNVRIENDRLIVPVEVPAGEVEAVLLDW